MGIVRKKLLRKLFLAWLLSLMLLGTFGAFIPQVVSGVPTTIRYLAIVPDDSETTFLAELEILTYTLQPLDVLNETDVTYDSLFSSLNTPRYNLIIWDRYPTINYDADLNNKWLVWHYNNGSNIMSFYDGLSYGGIKDEFVTTASGSTSFPHLTWINITTNPFTSSQNIQMDNLNNAPLTICYHASTHLKTGVNAFAYVNETTNICGYYVEEGEGHGRALWWGYMANTMYSPLQISANGIQAVQQVACTLEFPEIFMNSLFWVANAPVIKALPTFSARCDDHWGAAGSAEGNQDGSDYLAWLNYMKDKGIPFSHAIPTRHNNGTNSWQDTKNNTEWKDQRITVSPASNATPFAIYTVDAYMDGWLEWTSHGWTHYGNGSFGGGPNELSESFDYGTYQHTSHGIFDHVNESICEAETIFARYSGSISHEDINVLTIMGTSLYGNKTAYACYETDMEYVYSVKWSGWLLPNGTEPLGAYVDNQKNIGIWQGMTGANTASPSSSEIITQNTLHWNGYSWLSMPSNMYVHAGSWNDTEWSDGVPYEYIDMIEDILESGSWTRVLWMEDQGDYDKGFKSIVQGGSINWSANAPTWDGTTVLMSDAVSVPYIIRVPYGRYVSAVTVNGAGWYVFSDTEVYVPALATSVSITTANSAISTPHVQTVRRANRGVTATSYDGDQMTINLNGIKALYSEVEVYCGDKGRPVKVTGALSWSYDNTSKILSIIVAHSGSETVEIRWLTGDVNGDGIVDIFDIGAISAHWTGSPPGPLGYDSDFDLNDDTNIDIDDIGIVSSHWGQTL